MNTEFGTAAPVINLRSPQQNHIQAPFYIPATGPTSRPRRALKHGDTFIVVDSHGTSGSLLAGRTVCFTWTHGTYRSLSYK